MRETQNKKSLFKNVNKVDDLSSYIYQTTNRHMKRGFRRRKQNKTKTAAMKFHTRLVTEPMKWFSPQKKTREWKYSRELACGIFQLYFCVFLCSSVAVSNLGTGK